MTDLLILLFGMLVTAVTLTAVLLVGYSEARDPALNRTAAPAPRRDLHFDQDVA
jgi:hypothetical protein